MDSVMGALAKAGNAVGNVASFARDAAMEPFILVAEKEVEKYVGRKIDIDVENVPANLHDWVRKTGLNSLCVDDTWDFLEKSTWNERKVKLWEERAISKIVITAVEVAEEYDNWKVCDVEYEGSTMKITWRPYAYRWESGSSWADPTGYKRWWIIRDEIVFGLKLYQLPGKCFYKSDMLENFEDVDPNSCLPNGTSKFSRWVQFRHWVIFWYATPMCGYNYQYTTTPPKLPDGSLFNLDAILKVPSLPDLSLPSITLPSLPDVSLPSLPSAPSISAPSVPSLSAPSIDLSAPKLPPRKFRSKNKWAAHGLIELSGLNVKAKGSTIVLSDAKVHHFWENPNGGIDTETKEHQRFELKCTSAEQADSWHASLIEVGCKDGELGGCCTVA